MAQRVTQEALEAAISTNSNVRATQAAIEAAIYVNSNVRVSQICVEVAILNPAYPGPSSQPQIWVTT